MFTFLKFLHFLALVFGSVASLGNIYLMLSAGPHDLAAPGFTNTLRKFYRFTALGAIAVFWISGLVMVFWRYGIWIEGSLFSAKIVLAGLLTLSIAYLNLMSPSWARNSGPPTYLKSLHWINSIILMATVALAVIIFS